MAEIEVHEEGDGVWHVTVPGVDIKRDLPAELSERCYEFGLEVVGVHGAVLHVSPRDDLEVPITSALKDLSTYLAKVSPAST
jgi:hypothetical protein